MKKLGFIFVCVLIVSFLAYNYLYQEHRNIAEEQAEYVLDAEQLIRFFSEKPQQAQDKYLNKTIAVKGKISAIKAQNLILNKRVFCTFDKVPKGVKQGETVMIKGRCIGFDTLLGEVKIDQSSLLKQ